MNQQNINVKITTTGDTSGAAKVEDAIENINHVSEKRKSDGALDSKEIVAGWFEEAKAATEAKDKIGDVSEAADKMKDAFELARKSGMGLGGVGGTLSDISKIAGVEAATMAGYFGAIAMAAKWAFSAVSETAEGYKQALSEMEATGQEITPEFRVEVEALEASLGPIKAITDAWDDLVEAVTSPVDFFSGLGDFREWQEDTKAFMDFAQKAQREFLDNRYELMSSSVADIYDDEARALEKQLTLQQQINRARAELDSVAVARARNQVTIARQDGGDVGAAEANVVLVQLNAAIAALNDQVAQAQAGVEKAEQAMNNAKTQLNIAIQQNQPDAEIKKLEDIVADRESTFEVAQNALANQSALLKEKAAYAGENAEIDLVNLQDKYSGAYTEAAKKNFDAIKAKLEEVQGLASGETIGQIEALKTQVVTDHKSTMEAAKAVSAESTKASQQAGNDTVKAISEMGAANVGIWAAVNAALQAVKAQLDAQQQQINQLLAR